MERLDELARRYELPPGSAARFARLLGLVAVEPASITTVRDPARGADVHVADSLVALELPVVRTAGRVADLGAGGGFPGLALAVALPATEVVLVESAKRKAAFIRGAAEDLGLENVRVEAVRAESWTAGRDACDVVTARALAPLGVLLEYASPLLRVGGSLIAWKATPPADEFRDALAAGAILGMGAPVAHPVEPYLDAGARSLYVSSKVMDTPAGYPRREGMARKRPLRASSRG
ncbi:MAG: 16S rRNA (guanine(527)-N(7))-methyltransferase RsmG [Solirubrobacteraceae bacterium]